MTIHSRFVAIAAVALVPWAATDRLLSAQVPANGQVVHTYGPPVLLTAPLSDGFERIVVTEPLDKLMVSLEGPSVPLNSGIRPKVPSTEGVQVWLVKRDGSAIPRLPGLAHGRRITLDKRDFFSVGFMFEKVAAGELAGVVVQLNGKLLAWQIDPH